MKNTETATLVVRGKNFLANMELTGPPIATSITITKPNRSKPRHTINGTSSKPSAICRRELSERMATGEKGKLEIEIANVRFAFITTTSMAAKGARMNKAASFVVETGRLAQKT